MASASACAGMCSDTLTKIEIQLTDTGPNEDDAYVVLSDKNGQ